MVNVSIVNSIGPLPTWSRNQQSTVNQQSTDVSVELPLMSATVLTMTISGAYWSTTGGISVNYWWSVGRLSFDRRARVYRYYLPIYRPILSVILDTIHRYIDRYLILSTDVSADTPIGQYIWWLTETSPISLEYFTDTAPMLHRHLTFTECIG